MTKLRPTWAYVLEILGDQGIPVSTLLERVSGGSHVVRGNVRSAIDAMIADGVLDAETMENGEVFVAVSDRGRAKRAVSHADAARDLRARDTQTGLPLKDTPTPFDGRAAAAGE